jgi:GGDEF domain-containing protein
MGNNNDLVDYMQAVCHQLRILTGFDRIIVCRFGTYWDVDVIAESRSDAATSLRDFWFPNSDFPIEERLLCIANPVRVLRDAAAQTVEILASSESNVSFSRCSLLDFPEQRCARLRLIGIGSTMVISLTSQQSLWGMILCHHTKPLTVYAQTREFAEFVGKTTSGRLNRLEQDRIKIKQKYAQKLLDSITLQITDTKDIESTMHCYANELLSIVDADGVVVCANDWQFSHGATPPQTTLVVLLQWLRSLVTSSLCVSDSFPEEFIPARGTGLSGFLLVPLGSNLSGFFLWFRRDALQVLRDGVLDDTNRSKPWSPSDIDAGKLIGTALETIAANISPDKRWTDDTHINLVQMDETTLPNPDELKQRLDEAIDIGKQRRTKSGIVLIDYAPLQLHQHPAAVGEALVTHLRRMLRSHDMLIRWGDDKFIVVMTEIRGNAQDEVLHQRFTKSAVLPGVEFVRPHIGAAVFPADGLDGTSLIECALNALNASRLS